jgi:F420-dependent oxidoreductase-like protein
MIEGQDGLTWARWQRLARAAEELGYAGLYRSDHFTNPTGPLKDSLDLWASFTWLATHTSRIEFGPMVSPVSFRHPVIAAWSAVAIDDLSGGRFQFGLGAGWQEREHSNYGFPLLDLAGRFQRFEEALEVVTRLLKSEEPFAYEGAHYQLNEALLLPRPTARKQGPPVVIGGNGPLRTLPLAATYADEWNGVYITAEGFAERSARLDALCAERGRDPRTLRRTVMTRIVLAPTEAQAIATFNGDHEAARARGVLIGDPAQVKAGLDGLAAAGCQRVMAQWMDQDDIAGLELLATII